MAKEMINTQSSMTDVSSCHIFAVAAICSALVPVHGLAVLGRGDEGERVAVEGGG